jgi:hypothetical protein
MPRSRLATASGASGGRHLRSRWRRGGRRRGFLHRLAAFLGARFWLVRGTQDLLVGGLSRGSACALRLRLLPESLDPALFGEVGIRAARPDLRAGARSIRHASRAAHFLAGMMARWAVERRRTTKHQPEKA